MINEKQPEKQPQEPPQEEQLEEKQEKTLEYFKEMVLKLQQRVADSKKSQEIHLKDKLNEREEIYTKGKEIQELLDQAQNTYDYYIEMKEKGELDNEGKRTLEELEETLKDLNDQRLEIEKKFSTLSEQPEILDRLHDDAKKEDSVRTIEALSTEGSEKLIPQIEKIAESIKILADKTVELWKNKQTQERNIKRADNKISEAVTNILDKSIGKMPDFIDKLKSKKFNSPSPKEFKDKLEEVKDSLGFLKGKEKAVIDSILREKELFEKHAQEIMKLTSLDEEQNSIKGEQEILAEQLKKIIMEAWTIQNEKDKLSGKKQYSDSLPSSLHLELKKLMEKYGDVEHWEDGKKVGKYEGWYNANLKIEGLVLSRTWNEIEKLAGGNELIYNNPEELKDKK